MYIKKRTFLRWNDFKAVYRCEFCGHEFEGSGFNESFFYDAIVPSANCPKCGKNSRGETDDFGLDLR